METTGDWRLQERPGGVVVVVVSAEKREKKKMGGGSEWNGGELLGKSRVMNECDIVSKNRFIVR